MYIERRGFSIFLSLSYEYIEKAFNAFNYSVVHYNPTFSQDPSVNDMVRLTTF